MREEPVSIGPPSLGLSAASPMGVGLWSWGDQHTWGYNSFDPQLTEQSMQDAFNASLAAGVHLFDTAEVGDPWGLLVAGWPCCC